MSDEPARIYGSKLIAGYVGWFWAEVNRLEKRYLFCYWAGTILGLLSTIFAAFPKSLSMKLFEAGDELIGWIVVVFSASATFFSASLVPRYRRLVDDRDKGRIKLDAAKQRFEIEAFSELDRPKLSTLIAEIASVEADFGGIGKANPPQKSDELTIKD